MQQKMGKSILDFLELGNLEFQVSLKATIDTQSCKFLKGRNNSNQFLQCLHGKKIVEEQVFPFATQFILAATLSNVIENHFQFSLL